MAISSVVEMEMKSMPKPKTVKNPLKIFYTKLVIGNKVRHCLKENSTSSTLSSPGGLEEE